MQVFGPQLTGCTAQAQGVRKTFQRIQKAGQTMPVAVALGGDPVYAIQPRAIAGECR
jgi:4-hydroxy-3-polyprenylbenzoate decarboxylase